MKPDPELEAFRARGAREAQLEPSQRWHAGMTKPHQEMFAAWHAHRQGYRVFVPRIRKQIRTRTGRTRALRALFPRYIFIGFDPARDRWRPLNATYGMRALVMEDGRPKPAPQSLVEALMENADEAGAFDVSRMLQPGDRVRFLDGALADRLATLVEMPDAERARVLVELMGAEREIVAPLRDLGPAPA
ncbi:MAG: transcription termination/antitermination NusG family protein [Pseudomonadota bacterium]